MDYFNIISGGWNNISLIKLELGFLPLTILVLFFFAYSIIYNKFIENKNEFVHLILLPLNLALCIILLVEASNYLGITHLDYLEFGRKLSDFFIANYYIIIGFAVLGMILDQILHWFLFGTKQSEYTVLASSSGLLLDEVLFRFIMFGFLLTITSVEIAIYSQAVSYLIYYVDPLSSNRRKNANLNLMHGIIIGLLTFLYGWVIGFGIVMLKNIYQMIENKIFN